MKEKNYAKRQVVVSTLILIVLFGIFAALGYAVYLLIPTLENVETITGGIAEIMPELKQGLINDIKAGGASIIDLIKNFKK